MVRYIYAGAHRTAPPGALSGMHFVVISHRSQRRGNERLLPKMLRFEAKTFGQWVSIHAGSCQSRGAWRVLMLSVEGGTPRRERRPLARDTPAEAAEVFGSA